MELTGTPLFFSQLIANMSPSFGFFIKIFSAFNHFYFIINPNHHHLSPILLLQKPPIWTPCFYSFPLMACFQQNSLSDSVKMSIIQGPMQKQSWPQISEFFSHWSTFYTQVIITVTFCKEESINANVLLKKLLCY